MGRRCAGNEWKAKRRQRMKKESDFRRRAWMAIEVERDAGKGDGNVFITAGYERAA